MIKTTGNCELSVAVKKRIKEILSKRKTPIGKLAESIGREPNRLRMGLRSKKSISCDLLQEILKFLDCSICIELGGNNWSTVKSINFPKDCNQNKLSLSVKKIIFSAVKEFDLIPIASNEDSGFPIVINKWLLESDTRMETLSNFCACLKLDVSITISENL